MGYGRPRRLRKITTTCIFKSTCYTHWFLSRYARLTGQCQAQGRIATSITSLKPTLLNPCQWVEEANERCPGVPILLVGLKKDLREDPLAQTEMRKKSMHFTTDNEGATAAREIGARKYLECSSLTGEGVDDVFEAATRAALLTFEKGERGGCCVIL